ncbi:MAG: helix-turn-helix transcriptional regulator [Slackia sp.]|uniref:helix-turn-helix transcriptional regulator n=1 Tax=uncultured Slackia sp. TaxID=665903 RepID=UPI002804894C|nr:helix-turn-helix transcriptional regulator [uncultured Slackia sp.]MDU6010928.1 helix-turn-helix transcriptional regulator [Slackia sp.]
MSRLREKLIAVPFAFMGMGIFRVWTETVYSNGRISFPSQEGTGFDFAAFSIVAAIILIVVALLSKRIVTLYDKPWASPSAGVCLVLSACLNFLSLYLPQYAMPLGAVAVVAGDIGIVLIILLWSELFSCLNPLRVGLYFSGGLVLGALILWLFKGLETPWLWICSCLIPLVSLACLKKSYALLPDDERPHAFWGERFVPWKPIAIVVLYSFSYGLCENVFGHVLSIHSGLGCVFSAVLVYLAICWRKEGFSFSFTYKTACPLMIASLIPFGALMPFGGEVSAFFALAGYTLVLIAVMVIMSNLCYQHGFNALWLFGIERAARLLSVQAGIEIKSFWSSTTGASFFEMLLVGLAVAVMIALATYFFLSEARLTSSWGATLQSVDASEVSGRERMRLGEKCSQMAEAFALTAREEEVLVLLMQGKKPQQIERELYVANSTVKTHIKHLYRKLDVHSRQELMDLMGIEGPRES